MSHNISQRRSVYTFLLLGACDWPREWWAIDMRLCQTRLLLQTLSQWYLQANKKNTESCSCQHSVSLNIWLHRPRQIQPLGQGAWWCAVCWNNLHQTRRLSIWCARHQQQESLQARWSQLCSLGCIWTIPFEDWCQVQGSLSSQLCTRVSEDSEE